MFHKKYVCVQKSIQIPLLLNIILNSRGINILWKSQNINYLVVSCLLFACRTSGIGQRMVHLWIGLVADHMWGHEHLHCDILFSGLVRYFDTHIHHSKQTHGCVNFVKTKQKLFTYRKNVYYCSVWSTKDMYKIACVCDQITTYCCNQSDSCFLCLMFLTE